MLDAPSEEEVNHWINTAFEKMENLRILIIRNTEFSDGPSYLPNTLQLLEREGTHQSLFLHIFIPTELLISSYLIVF